MNPERWQQIDKIFQGALEREPHERASFLSQACGDDSPLREKIEALLPWNVTIEQQMEKRRWDFGSWDYFQLLTTPDVAEIAAAFQQLAEKIDGSNAEMLMKGDLLDMACRVIVRLERAGAFDALRRTPDFRVICIYREPTMESDEETAQRLSRVRNSLTSS